MIKFNKPDVKASRVRKPVFRVSVPKILKRLKKKNLELKDISVADFKQIIKDFSYFMREKAFTERDGIELPEGLGFVFIASVKIRKEVIDIPRSLEIGVKLLAKNWETDGMSPKIMYTNFAMKYKFSTRQIWSFRGTRDFKREVSKEFRQDWKKFIQTTNTKRIVDFYKTTSVSYTAEKFITDDYDYNEFDI